MEKLLHKLIRRFKTNDPFIIAVGLGIHIRFNELDEGTRGFYYKKLRNRFIVIDSKLDEPWQRFVCAHELAHDRLHPGFSRFWLDEQSFFNVGKYERQANKFATQLLLANSKIELGETLADFCLRNGLPPELNEFYFPLQFSM